MKMAKIASVIIIILVFNCFSSIFSFNTCTRNQTYLYIAQARQKNEAQKEEICALGHKKPRARIVYRRTFSDVS